MTCPNELTLLATLSLGGTASCTGAPAGVPGLALVR